jgi:hypothetical protein
MVLIWYGGDMVWCADLGARIIRRNLGEQREIRLTALAPCNLVPSNQLNRILVVCRECPVFLTKS